MISSPGEPTGMVRTSFFFLGCICGMQRFPGQGPNLHHCSNSSCCSDNARSLFCWATGELLGSFLNIGLRGGEWFLMKLICITTLNSKPWSSYRFFVFLIFRATLAAYGSFQARGWISATAASLHHSSWQCQILNPLCRARDWTCIFMDTSRFQFLWATRGTPLIVLTLIIRFSSGL